MYENPGSKFLTKSSFQVSITVNSNTSVGGHVTMVNSLDELMHF